MSYFAVKFLKEVPGDDTVEYANSFDGFALVKIKDPNYRGYLTCYHAQITEDEYTRGMKFYAECRSYRSAYSDVEGLQPDPESLAEGKRKTKVYKTPEDESATTSLMKKIAKLRVKEVFDQRTDKTNETEVLAEINSCANIKDVCMFLENRFGQEIPWPYARELGLITVVQAVNGRSYEQRVNPPIWGVKF